MSRTERFEATRVELELRFPVPLARRAAGLLRKPLEANALPLPEPSTRGDFSSVYSKGRELGKPLEALLAELGALSETNEALFFMLALHLEELQHAIDASTYTLPLAQLLDLATPAGSPWTSRLEVPGLMENKPELSLFDMIRLRRSDGKDGTGKQHAYEFQAFVLNIVRPKDRGGLYSALIQLPEVTRTEKKLYTAPHARWAVLFHHVHDHFDLMCVCRLGPGNLTGASLGRSRPLRTCATICAESRLCCRASPFGSLSFLHLKHVFPFSASPAPILSTGGWR